jgi:hypothetical protein
MPDTKTSDETAAAALDGTELIRIVQGGNMRKATAAQVRTSGYQTIATDAAVTLTVGVDAEHIRHSGTLTADRAITLATAGAYAGASFLITRTGSGAFNLDVGTGPLKSLATATWAEFVYTGSAWYLAAYGAL